MFEWDPQKSRSNLRKHGVSFSDTSAVFEDPLALTISEEVDDEERFITIGMDDYTRLLVVVYTWRGDNIRIIPARKAIKAEVTQYESQI